MTAEKKIPPHIPSLKRDPIPESPKFEEWLKWYAEKFPESSKWINARKLMVEKFLREAEFEPGKFVKTRDFWWKLSPEERIRFFVERFREVIRENRALRLYLENCTHCGYCIDKCQMWIATRDYHNSPVGRVDLVRAIFKYYDKLTGKLFSKLVDAKELTEQLMEELWIYFHQCTECRRCAYFCPFGIDTAEVTRAVRQIFAEMGMVYEFVGNTVRSLMKTGNHMFLNAKAIRAVFDMVQEEIKEETGKDIEIPLDKPKAKILFLPSSTDVFTNLDTLKGFVKTMYALGLQDKYTFSSEVFEVGNFGLFVSDYHLTRQGKRIAEVATRLGAELVIFGECGHGWRAFKNYVIPELEKRGIKAIHFMQLVVWAIKKRKLKLRKLDYVVTYHDPCNLSRAGDLIEEPRIILRTVCKEFREREHNKHRTLCCGAGTGLLGDDVIPLRVWAGWPSVYDAWKTGAQILATPCSIDKAQFPVVINYHIPGQMTVKGLADLVGYALEL